jgi:hypothetical protein
LAGTVVVYVSQIHGDSSTGRTDFAEPVAPAVESTSRAP